MGIAAPEPVSATTTGQLGLYELHTGDVLAGRFRIESMLGIGGMGVVYRAFDQSLDIPVAIKLLRPELARRPEAFERFRQELLLARQVSSPHVVRIHDIAQDGGRWFISMDFIDGESLEKFLDGAGPLDAETALRITHDLLDGICAAEQRGVVHRDLKPANILLDADGSAFITDFGVARSLGASVATGTGVIIGTPEYLSPEQARGQPVDTRSDLYTVGLILYEMLTGSLPFSVGTPAENVMQRIVRPPPSLAQARAGLPPWLYAFVDRLLKVNPAHRFATAREAMQALQARRVPRSPLARRRILLVALVIVAFAGATAWLSRHPLVLPSPEAPLIPRTAVLPLSAPAGDAELNAIARALDEHLQAWLRDDPHDATVQRRRVLDAIARAAPGVQGDVLLRQLPEIAGAANATQIVHGQLRRDGAQLVLDLSLWRPDPANSARISIRGGDAVTLGEAYLVNAGELLRKGGIAASAPTFPPAVVASFGQALEALDAHDAEQAAGQLAALAGRAAPNALVYLALLEAQEQAQQESPAQTTRDHVIAGFAPATGASARELQARALIGSDKAEAAISVLDKALHDYPHDPALALLDAQTLVQTGAGAKAFATLQQYVAADNQDAEAWFLLGRVAIEQGRAQSAVDDYLTRALVLNTRSGNQAAAALTRNAIGVGYERLGQFEAAAEQYGQAATLYERLNDETGQAKALRNLALVQAVRGDRATAARTLERVKALLEKSGDRSKLADLYSARGVVAEEQGNWSEALAFYRQALAVQQQLNQPAGIAESLNNVGFSSYSLGDFDNAMVYWQQALALYRQLDDPSKALRIEESIALLDIARGRFDAARQSLDAAQRKAEDHQLPEEAAVAHAYLCELALVEGRFADALAESTRAAEVFGRLSDQRGQTEAALLQARAQLALGDAAAADKTLGAIAVEHVSSEQHAAYLLASARQAMLRAQYAVAAERLDAAAKIGGDPHGTIGAQIQIEQIRLSLAQNDVPRAAKLLVDLGEDSMRLGDVPLRLQWLELQAAAALRGNKPAVAATYYGQALAILKTTGSWADAAVLHALGAAALASRPSDADAARANASAQQDRLLQAAPESARAGLQSELARRLRDEAGMAHD